MDRRSIGGHLESACMSLWLVFLRLTMKHPRRCSTTFLAEVSFKYLFLVVLKLLTTFIVDIEYPDGDEALSEAAVQAVEQFLTMDPDQRPMAKEVQEMPFFSNLNWSSMETVEPPFIPNPDNPTDTGYFEARNIMQHLKLSSFDLED